MLQVHQAQVGLDRYRRPPNRAGKTRNERLQESLIVEKLIHRRQLRRQRPHLCRHHRVEQLRLTVAQPEHQSLLGRELDREQRRTRSSIVPADASLRRIVFQGDVVSQIPDALLTRVDTLKAKWAWGSSRRRRPRRL